MRYNSHETTRLRKFSIHPPKKSSTPAFKRTIQLHQKDLHIDQIKRAESEPINSPLEKRNSPAHTNNIGRQTVARRQRLELVRTVGSF